MLLPNCYKITTTKRYFTFLDPRALGFRSDLAVLELAQRIRFDAYKRPAALAMPHTPYIDGTTEFKVTGWGSRKETGESSSKLMQATMPYVDFEHCQKMYAKLGLTYVKVAEGMICAGKY